MHRPSPNQPDQTGAIANRRRDNLALAYQELFTVIVRLRTERFAIHDAAGFRHQIREGVETARNLARSHGYTDEDIKVTTFAVVAFLDESILSPTTNVRSKGDLAGWDSRPLQLELFGVVTAGEIFFRNIDYLLNRDDSPELADVLETHELCLLLGFHGRYGQTEDDRLRAIAARLHDRIRRIRGQSWPIQASWRPEPVALTPSKAGVRRLSWAAAAIWILALCLFFAYTFVLRSNVTQLAAPALFWPSLNLHAS